MSKFTSGEWEYSEYVPEGITLNGREYLIQADGEDVALARTEADAELIVKAPAMYSFLLKIEEELRACAECDSYDEELDDCKLLAENIADSIKELFRLEGEHD